MRAVVINEFGGRDQLQLADIPTPEPGPNDVQVALAYAATNPADWKFREGRGRLFATFQASFPFVLGLEGVGIVSKVGANVKAFRAGDRVAMRCNQRAGLPGSYAQFAVTAQEAVATIPEGVSLADAATIPVAAVTAYQAIMYAGGLKAGMDVLVHGAAGGVGSFVTQFAKAFGARVAATCSARNADYVQRLGADLVIDYAGSVNQVLKDDMPAGVDVLVDCVGMHSLTDPLSMIKPGGIDVRIVTLTASDQESPTSEEARQQGKRVIVKVVDQSTAATDMAAILALMSEGRVRAPETEILPLEQAAEAHRRLEERQVRGKLLLAIDQD